MSSSGSSASHSRFHSSTSSSSSLSNTSDIYHDSEFPLDPLDSGSYAQQSQIQFPRLSETQNSFDNRGYRNHDGYFQYGLSRQQYQHIDRQPAPERSQGGSFEESQHLRNEIQWLREQNLILKAQNALLQKNFDQLLATLSNPSSSMNSTSTSRPVPPIVVLTEADFPKAKYWQKTRWTAHIDKERGRSSASGRSATSKNSLLFITTEAGDAPTSPRISQARNSANAFYFELKTDNLLLETWGKATLSVMTRFRAVLEAEIPELRLCAGHWKVDKLASITYPSWCGSHRKSDKVKLEDLEDDFDNDEYENNSDDEQLKRKRTATSTTNHSVKKPKPSSTVSVNRTTGDSGKGKSVDDGAGKIVKRQRPKNPLFGQTPPPSAAMSPSIPSMIPSQPSAPSSSSGPPPQPAGSMAPLPLPVLPPVAAPSAALASNPPASPALSATSLPSTLPPLPVPSTPPPLPAPSPPTPPPPPSAALSAPPADSATPPLVLPPPPSNLSPPHLRKLDCLYLNPQQLQLPRL
ncbi:hypothetical protein B0H19DRAFT_1367816 [Mycena capillaripes]|nr:hypothetical protein B0H19DRAFT_1367816 [Mycena capillaripes]